MRRPQTKTPYAYFHHGARHRGRPVHRIYTATPRPDMHATFYKLHNSTFFTVIGMTKNGVFFWCSRAIFGTDWADFKASSEPGRVWNEKYWAATNPANFFPAWPDFDVLLNGAHGPWGPTLKYVQDSFTT